MRQRSLYGIVLLGSALAVGWPVVGQSPDGPARPLAAAWASSASEPVENNQMAASVIATTRHGGTRSVVPPESQISVPDDGLRPPKVTNPPQPTRTLPGGPGTADDIQRVSYLPPQDRVEPAALTSLPPDRNWPPSPTPATNEVGSCLKLHVTGPDTVAPGKRLPCRIEVSNSGRHVLAGVIVELPLPPRVRVLSTTPTAVRKGDRLIWELGNLDAGGRRDLAVDLQTIEVSDISIRPMARFASAVGLLTRVVRPPFSIMATGPETATVSSTVTFQIEVGNHTSTLMSGVMLNCKLSQGLQHPQGKEIEAELGDLPPGQVKTLSLDVQTQTIGRQGVMLLATNKSGQKMESEVGLVVSEPALTMALEGPRQGTLEADMQFKVRLVNPGRFAAPNSTVNVAMPEGMEFVSARSGGEYVPSTRTVSWTVVALPPEQRQILEFQARTKKRGDWALAATARTEGAPEIRATHAVHVAVNPTLSLEITAHDNTIVEGGETLYELRIYNPGPLPAKAVRLGVFAPEVIEVVGADGPTPGRRSAGGVAFDQLDEMRARVDAAYRIRVRGVRAGEGRLRLVVFADGMERPVQQERTCQVKPRAQ